MARKSDEEARLERMTWYAIVGVLLVMLYFDRDLRLPAYLAPMVIALILLGVNIYQQMSSGYKPSLIAVIIAVVLLLTGAYDIYYGLPFVDLRLLSIVGVVVVILAGVITNEG